MHSASKLRANDPPPGARNTTQKLTSNCRYTPECAVLRQCAGNVISRPAGYAGSAACGACLDRGARGRRNVSRFRLKEARVRASLTGCNVVTDDCVIVHFGLRHAR
jgi:hypothetical protein